MSNYHFADEHSSPGRAWVSMDIAVWMSCSAINLHEVRALPECQLLIHHRVCQFRCLPGYGMSHTPREQSGSRGRQCRAPCRLGTSSRGWAHGRQLWGSRVRDGHQWRGACTTQEGARTGSDGVVRIQACSATGHDTMAKWLQTSEMSLGWAMWIFMDFQLLHKRFFHENPTCNWVMDYPYTIHRVSIDSLKVTHRFSILYQVYQRMLIVRRLASIFYKVSIGYSPCTT